jgi:magnesium transporter
MPPPKRAERMLTAYRLSEKGLEETAVVAVTEVPADATWVDLRQATLEEDAAAEKFLHASLPSREETEEIEFSSRFYAEDGAVFMTASLLTGVDRGRANLAPFTVVVAGDRIVTVRYDDLRAVRSSSAAPPSPAMAAPPPRRSSSG